MKGWTIAVSVEVVTEKLAITPDLSEAARKDREKKMEWVKQNFEIEEDYSIERLYAKLSCLCTCQSLCHEMLND